jgi:hypothetical protein
VACAPIIPELTEMPEDDFRKLVISVCHSAAKSPNRILRRRCFASAARLRHQLCKRPATVLLCDASTTPTEEKFTFQALHGPNRPD